MTLRAVSSRALVWCLSIAAIAFSESASVSRPAGSSVETGGGAPASGTGALGCVAPPEIGTILAGADTRTFSWPAEPAATRYAVVRGLTSGLPVGPGGGDERCFPGLSVPSLVDNAVPALGTAFWYLARAENACANGPFGARSDGSPHVTTTCPLDQTPPTVSITDPAANSTLSGSVAITATATDDYGVVGVLFRVDGNPIGAEDTDAP